MAVTLKRVPDGDDIWGRKRISVYDVTLDTSYPAGGYSIDARDVGLRNIYGANVVGGNLAGGRVLPHINVNAAAGDLKSSVKFSLFFPTGGATASPTSLADPVATVANATIPSGAVAVTSTAANGAIVTVPDAVFTPGQGKEVGAAADVSTLTYRVIFIGD